MKKHRSSWQSRLGWLVSATVAVLIAAQPALSQQAHSHKPSHNPPGQNKPKKNHDRGPQGPKHKDNPGKGHDKNNPGKGNKSISATDWLNVIEASAAPTVGASSLGTPNGVALALRNGSLTSRGGTPVATETQRAVFDLVGLGETDAAAEFVESVLSPSNAGARMEALQLSMDLQGLLRDPSNLRDAVISYNAFVAASSDEFLRNPSQEFLATQRVLALLIDTSTAND